MNTRHYYLCLLRTLVLAALTAAAAAACSDDNGDPDGREPVTPDGGIPVTFTANINPGSDAAPAGAPGTRTILTPDGGGFTVTWNGKDNNPTSGYDLIHIWAALGNTLENNGSTKLYVPTTSAASSALEPQNESNKLTLSSAGEWTFTAIYGSSQTIVGRAGCTLSPRSQSEPNNNEHIAERDFSVATATKHVETGDMPANINFTFHHLLSAMQLHVTNETGAALTVQEIRLSAAGGKIDYSKTYDVAEENWGASEYKKDYLQLTITTPAALAPNATPQNFYMLFFPGYANTDMTITVITDRGEFTLTKKAPASPGFEAGKNYMTDIAIKSNPGTGETWSEYVDISTADELKTFRDNVNNGTNYAGKIVRLKNHINLANATWTPIGTDDSKPFSGTFDGGGYLISYLNVNISTDYAGLFGNIDDGTVRNLRVKGKVTTTGNYVGGIVGELQNSSVENCIFDGTVNGGAYVGGIAGSTVKSSSITGQIAGCHTKGKVTATGNVAGGIVGTHNGITMTDCYSEAEVTAMNIAGGIVGSFTSSSAITRCYATGKISGESIVGGIAGYTNRSTITGCIALNPGLTRTSGNQTTFGRVVGQNNNHSTTITDCYAFKDMTIKDASNNNITAGATSVAGDDLTADACLTNTTYTDRGFTTDNDWSFNNSSPWTYLPYNKAFRSFPNLYETDYTISADYLNNGTN